VKIRVDSALCVGHGRCYEIAPDVFGDDERGHCVLLTPEVAPEHRDAASKAEANCPEQAIVVER
jgi:ferredoxin